MRNRATFRKFLDNVAEQFDRVSSNKALHLEMPQNKAFRQIEKDLRQKKKEKGKVSVEDQGAYVDSNRNIAVTLDSKELSKALKNFERDGVS